MIPSSVGNGMKFGRTESDRSWMGGFRSLLGGSLDCTLTNDPEVTELELYTHQPTYLASAYIPYPSTCCST